MDEIQNYKLGDIVELITTGAAYSRGCEIFDEVAIPYVLRYKPINVHAMKNNEGKIYGYRIESFFKHKEDLAKRTDLVWKIRYIFKKRESQIQCQGIYIISSNQNHMLIIARRGIRPKT